MNLENPRQRLILGTMRLAGEFDGLVLHRRERSTIVEFLQTAFELGFRSFDTAPLYALGTAENLLGETLPMSHCNLWTKVGVDIEKRPFPRLNYSLRGLERSLEGSLNRLNCNCVDAVFIHNPSPDILAQDAIYTFLSEARSKKQTIKTGISLISILDAMYIPKDAPVDLLMIPDRDFREYPTIRDSLSSRFSIVIREVLLGGSIFSSGLINASRKTEFVNAYLNRTLKLTSGDVIVGPRTFKQLAAYESFL